jgi:hypothetical protein
VSYEEELEFIRFKALEVFKPEGVKIWIDAKNPLLEGKTPREMVEEGRGYEVVTVLQGLAEGVMG